MGLEIPAWRARNAFVSYISRPRHLSPHYLWQMHAFYRTFAFKVPWVTEVVVFSARGGIFRGRPKAKATSGAWVTLKTLLKTEAAHETLADPHLQIFWSKNKGGGAAPLPPRGPSPGSTTVKSLLHSGELWGKLTHRRCVRTETLIVDVIVRFVLETS